MPMHLPIFDPIASKERMLKDFNNTLNYQSTARKNSISLLE